MAVNHDLKCSANCGAPMQEERVERRGGVLYQVPFEGDPVRAVCEACGADLEVVLTAFAIGGRAMDASRTGEHDFKPFAQAHAAYRNDRTGVVTDLGKVVLGADEHGCLAFVDGADVRKALSETPTVAGEN